MCPPAEPPRRDHGAFPDAAIAAFYQQQGHRVQLAAGDVLMHQDEANDRLYLVLSGTLRAASRAADGRQYTLFHATPQTFIGVYSFFSRTFRSLLTVVAEEPCEVAYVDAAHFDAARAANAFPADAFVPVVATELAHRHQHILDLALERERTMAQLLRTEKLASLGQMAAGIAHELNNAIAVLQRNSQWLCRSLRGLLGERAVEEFPFFAQGLDQGQALSSRQARERQRRLQRQYRLPEPAARQLAEMNVGDEKARWLAASPQRVGAGHLLWRMGTALHDMLIAADQATHVLRSIRTLGAPHLERTPGQDVNETIRESLSLLQSPLRSVDVRFTPGPVPPLHASKGELVQVWTNLIRNAAEALDHAGTPEPALAIATSTVDDGVRVRITDNGPGIPADILPQIFQPNVSTKVGGLSFGLGLGLTIVEHIVTDYGGRVMVDSVPGRTVFEVRLPLGG